MLLVNHHSISSAPAPSIQAAPSKAPHPQKKVPDITYGSGVGLKKFIKDPLTYQYLHVCSYIKNFPKRPLNRLNGVSAKHFMFFYKDFKMLFRQPLLRTPRRASPANHRGGGVQTLNTINTVYPTKRSNIEQLILTPGNFYPVRNNYAPV